MWNIENTFVNELVAGAGRRQVAVQDGDAEGVAADASGLTRPLAMPIAAPSSPRRAAPGSFPVAHRALGGPTSAGPVEPASPRRLYAVARRATAPRMPEQLVPTFQLRRKSELQTVVGRLVLPIAVLLGTGAVVGSYVAFGGAAASGALAGAMAAAAPAAVAPVVEPAPAPAPAPVEPAAAPAPAVTQIGVVSQGFPQAGESRGLHAIDPLPSVSPALVDVRIDSTPPGATVMLVDRGRTQVVGETPVDAAVDPAREYDLVFTYAGSRPRVEHIDPATTRRVSVTLGGREPAPHRSRSRKR